MPRKVLSIPQEVNRKVAAWIAGEADKVDFVHLTIPEKTRYYKIWTTNPMVVEALSAYMPIERIHPYVKDSILKPYARSKKPGADDILRIVEATDAQVVEHYVKPLAVRLSDGRVMCWGLARDWKNVLLSVVERAHLSSGNSSCFAAILLDSGGGYAHSEFRGLVELAGRRLGIGKIVFLQ